MWKLSRRRFIYASAAFTPAAVLGSPIWCDHPLHATEVEPEHVGTRRASYSRTSRALGSRVSLTALHEDRDAAKLGVEEAFCELETIERVMSLYRPDSQVSRLNQRGRVDDAHPYLIRVLHAARLLSKRSRGAFDITVQPLWELYHHAERQGRLPTSEEIDAICERVDWNQVEITGNRVRLARSRGAITLNGIAQGFALDVVFETLRKHGIRDALVDTGEIGTEGQKADGNDWTIGIQHPRHDDAFVAVVELDGRCLATSGDYASTFSDDRVHHHLIDPHTGCSPSELSSVSIMAPSGIQADSLSTAVFVGGKKRGFELIRSLPGIDAFFVDKDGRTTATSGFPLKG